jgi:hypothetical protein
VPDEPDNTDGGQEPTVEDTTPPAEPPAAQVADDGDDFDKERALATIRKLRDAEKQGKADAKRVAELEARLKEHEEAQLSELEKAQKRADDLAAQLADREAREREMRLRLGVHQLAPTLGIADTDIALALLDVGKVEYDDGGDPKNLADLLTDLLEAKPLLKGQPPRPTGSTDAGAGSGAKPPPQLTADELEAARSLGMDPERYVAFKNVSSFEDYERLRAATST